MRRRALPLLAAVVCACNNADSPVSPQPRPATRAQQSATASPAPPVLLDLGTLGGQQSYATAINDRGTVVGWSETASGRQHAFRWTKEEGMIDLGSLADGDASYAAAILNRGTILGGSGERSVLWSASGTLSELRVKELQGGQNSRPSDFNERGEMVGTTHDLGHATYWSPSGEPFDLSFNVPGHGSEGAANAITSSGLVALVASIFCGIPYGHCWRSYIWSRTRGYVYLGAPDQEQAPNVEAFAVNAAGIVAGMFVSHTQRSRAFRWDDKSGFTFLSQPADGFGEVAMAVSANGTVAGSSNGWAVVWPARGAAIPLAPGAATAINASGTVVGWALLADDVRHAVVWMSGPDVPDTAVPRRASSPSMASTERTPCLRDASVTSRQMLFECLMHHDRGR